MERSRGSSRGRGSFRGSSSSHSRPYVHHHTSSSSSHHNVWQRPNGGSYSSGYDSRSMHNGIKRKYDLHQHDLRKTLHHSSDYHDRKSYHDDLPRKQFRPESSHHHESRSHHHHHHRSDYEYETTRSVTYRDNPSSHHHQHHNRYRDDDHSARRYSGSYSSGQSSHHRGLSSHRGHGSPSGYIHGSRRDESSKSPSIRDASDDMGGSVSPSRDPKLASEGQTSPEKNSAPESRKVKPDPDELEQADDVLTLTEEDRAAEEDEDAGSRADETEVKVKTEPATGETESSHVESDSVHSKAEGNDESRSRSKQARRSESPRRNYQSSGSHEPPHHFIRLQCPHCHQRAVTFKEYISHLSNQRHAESLRKISVQHRMSLAKLRTRQRKEQKQMEAQSSRPPHSTRMNFCAICKLYHSESRPNHETTELHKIIKNFLMPYCPICRVSFKSRMLYEKHVATLTHIKNKDNMEKTYERRRTEEQKRRDQEKSQAAAANNTSAQGEEDDVDDLNLDNFMVLDAVGSDADGDPLEETPVGQNWVKRVEVLYCDVCQRYLHRTECDLDKAAELHCRSRAHHQATEDREREPEEQHDEVTDQCASEAPEANGMKEEALKRSPSEERLLEEAGQDIGDVDEGAHAAEGQNDGEEENNNEEADAGDDDDDEEQDSHQDEDK